MIAAVFSVLAILSPTLIAVCRRLEDGIAFRDLLIC